MPDPPDAVPADPAAPTGPARTREAACEGYRRALAAHQEVALPRQVDPGIAAAVERQTAAMRELFRRAFPEIDVAVPDDATAPIERARTERRRQADASHAAVLRRGRAERAAPELSQPVKWHEPTP
ncbi:hypothetical protein OG728_02125 [Streptomyces microflavus]|uniref:hypothetical protein n=1 Tax=Streptomyces microflavus TaxID=1919 RepID=UPI002E14E231|nr:hypothetical protein OG728_02125 [Streptomyces microflavus]